MATNTTAKLTLIPNAIHCVKTGLAIVSFADPNALAQLNQAIKDGKVECGTAIGRILIEEGLRPNGSKNFRWKQYSRSKSQWLVFTGGKIGEHNESVLKDNGFTADPATRSKGTVGNRQYGVFAEAKKPAQEQSSGTFLGGNKVTVTPEDTEALVESLLASKYHAGTCPLPNAIEMQGVGSYGRWKTHCKSLGFSQEEANHAWKAAKSAILAEQAEPTVKATPSKPAIVMPPPPKAQPKAKTEGTVLHVPAASLQKLLSTIGEAKVEYNANTDLFTVSM